MEAGLDTIKEALQLGIIHIEENPSDSAPTRKLRAALAVVDEMIAEEKRLDEVLTTVYQAIYEKQSGAILRPQPEVVNLLQALIIQRQARETS